MPYFLFSVGTPGTSDSSTVMVDAYCCLPKRSLKRSVLGVSTDSRCPSDVVCVWEGQATVNVNVTIDKVDQGGIILTERAGHDDLASRIVGSHVISLVTLEPYPVSTHPIPTEDYRAEFKVSEVRR